MAWNMTFKVCMNGIDITGERRGMRDKGWLALAYVIAVFSER